MKINFDAVMVDENLEDFRDGDGPVTLSAISKVMLGAMMKDESVPGEEKIKRYELICKIKNSPEGEFSSEEITQIKDVLKKYSASVVMIGQACELLENRPRSIFGGNDPVFSESTMKGEK